MLKSELPIERMRSALPRKFPEFTQFNIKEFAEDAVRLDLDREELAERIGHHMAIGTQISDSQIALIDCFSNLNKNNNYRYTVIDAFSIAEVIAFGLIHEAAKSNQNIQKRYNKLIDKNERVTIKEAIHSFLQQILSPYLKYRQTLIGDLDKCRKLRNKVAHEQESATANDAKFVLNTAQQLLFSFEEFRGERPIN